MISSIEISRFRGIREGKLEDLTPLVVLVGPNGCGKSTVLDALLIAASPGPCRAIGETVRRHQGVELGARWLFPRAQTRESPAISVHTTTKFHRECQLHWQTPPPEGQKENEATIECKVILRKAGSTGRAENTVRFRGSRFNALDSAPPLGDVPDIRLVDTHAENRHIALHQLYSDTARAGRREQATSLVAEVAPGLKHLEILAEGDKAILYFVYEDCAIPAALAGDGIHALVRAVLQLASLPEGVVLFEEPEVHQHPRAIRQAMRAVLAAVRRDIQVVLTTHSLELIDALLAESSEEDLDKLSLYRLELEDGRLISVRVPGSEVAFSRCEVEKDLR